jgi:GUCT (NUC152) domain
VDQVKGMRLTKDQMGAVFDVPAELADDFLAKCAPPPTPRVCHARTRTCVCFSMTSALCACVCAPVCTVAPCEYSHVNINAGHAIAAVRGRRAIAQRLSPVVIVQMCERR